MTQVKALFLHHLVQLRHIVSKIPDAYFGETLTEGMFTLEMHAKIASNFSLRGYCPLLQQETPDLFESDSGRDPVLKQIDATVNYLESLQNKPSLDDNNRISDKAGFAEVDLPESEYISLYIIPNLLFHMGMVYAIARANGVPLSKGDFDGLHSYPAGFQFTE